MHTKSCLALLILLTTTSIIKTMESDWEVTPPVSTDAIHATSLKSSTIQSDGTVEQTYSDGSKIIKYPNGRIDTHHRKHGLIKEEHPNGTRVYRDHDKEETILPNGTIHLIMAQKLTSKYQVHSDIQASIYAVPTILTEDDPNYIPTPYTQLPTGSVVGSFTNNHFIKGTLRKQTKVKTIAFPDGSFISEGDTTRTLFESHTESYSLLYGIIQGNYVSHCTQTTTPKTENPYAVVNRSINNACLSEILRNPIAVIAHGRANK